MPARPPSRSRYAAVAPQASRPITLAVSFKVAVGIDEYVLEDVMDAYVDWRDQSRSVWTAYHHWTTAPREEAGLRFAAYVAELDQEHRACEVYEATIARTADRL